MLSEHAPSLGVGRGRETSVIQGQLGLCLKLQASQGCIVQPSFKRRKKFNLLSHSSGLTTQDPQDSKRPAPQLSTEARFYYTEKREACSGILTRNQVVWEDSLSERPSWQQDWHYIFSHAMRTPASLGKI